MEPSEIQSKKTSAGICAILVGGFGVHKFILGYNNVGLITILISVLTCGAGAAVMGIIGLIEGIIYLTMTDTEFYETYIVNKKEWF
jgi:TM2 domain-containing membrane protein YozV